jgi:hypothetical protein
MSLAAVGIENTHGVWGGQSKSDTSSIALRKCGGVIAETADACPRCGTARPRTPVIEIGRIAMLVIANLYVLLQRYGDCGTEPDRSIKNAPLCAL